MGYGLLNLGSLLLGLIAWVFPVINLAQQDKKNQIIFSIISVSACAVALFMQILYGNHLVKIEDWSALMDTSHAVALVSAILLVVTITLNAIALAVYSKRGKK